MPFVKDNVIYGGDMSSNITTGSRSLAEFALKRFEEIGGNKILFDGISGREYSGEDILRSVIHLANCLQKLGIKEGDVIGICAENRIEFTIIIYATLCLNATIAPLNVTYNDREMQHAVNIAGPKILFVSPQFAEKISKIITMNAFIEYAFIFSEESSFGNMKPYLNLINNCNIQLENKYKCKETNINDNVAFIMCSSGTTGLPKGAQITQGNVMNFIAIESETKTLWKELIVLIVLPWFHAYGCITMIVASMLGYSLVYLPKFEEITFLSTIEKYKVNILLTVPPLMVFLAKHPMVDNYDLSSLVFLYCAAAPLRKETEDAVRNRIKIPFIQQAYGLSETTLVVAEQSIKFRKPGSVGIIKKSVYGKVIDVETSKLLGPNEEGELLFKGGIIMKGYIGDNKSTQALIDKDGWLHTGDIGYYDNDLEFFVVDRIKELIKYKGFQVPPAEIEALLLTHPKIKDAAVVGLPDEECGELPFAFVVKQSNADLSEQDVMDFVAEKVSSIKRIRGGVQFVKSIPKNASGKILRRILRDMLKERNSELLPAESKGSIGGLVVKVTK